MRESFIIVTKTTTKIMGGRCSLDEWDEEGTETRERG